MPNDFSRGFTNTFGRSFSRGQDIGASAVERMMAEKQRAKEIADQRKYEEDQAQKEKSWQFAQKFWGDIQNMKDRVAKRNGGKMLAKTMKDRGLLDDNQFESYKQFFSTADSATMDAGMEQLQKIIGAKNDKDQIAKSEWQNNMSMLENYDSLDPIKKEYVDKNILKRGQDKSASEGTQTDRDRAMMDLLVQNYGKTWNKFEELPASQVPLAINYGAAQYDMKNVGDYFGIDPLKLYKDAQELVDNSELDPDMQVPLTLDQAMNQILEGTKQAGALMGKVYEDPSQKLSPQQKAMLYFESLNPKPETNPAKKLNLWDNFGQNAKSKEDDFSDILNRR